MSEARDNYERHADYHYQSGRHAATRDLERLFRERSGDCYAKGLDNQAQWYRELADSMATRAAKEAEEVRKLTPNAEVPHA